MPACLIRRVLKICGATIVAGLSLPLPAADRFELVEPADDSRVFATTVDLQASGRLFTTGGAENALKLTVAGRFEFDERRVAGTGRDALSLRSVRHYRVARGSIDAGGQITNPLLRDEVRLVVTAGQSEGLDLFSPAGPLTFGELELLKTPADTLAVRALLPESRIDLEEIWRPADWVLPLLVGIEAAEKSTLTCRLATADSQIAKVTFEGETLGAALGAAANVKVEGALLYDLPGKFIRRVELTQTEKRSIGAVSPGLDVVAKVVVERQPIASPKRLTDADLARITLEPNEASRLLMFDAPAWNMRFYHDRAWHLIQQNTETAILRLLDKGGLIAQCNIRKLPNAEPGQHASEKEFESDIERTLGKDFQQIVQAEQVKLKPGLYVHRVVAVGAVNRVNDKKEPVVAPMQWIYYLVANSDGRQVGFVFSIDPKLADQLQSRDLSIVGGVEFLNPRPRLVPTSVREK